MDNREDRGVAHALWARVEHLRIEAGMAKTDLARRSGVRRQTYMDLQHTTRRPRRDIVLALASAVGLDSDEALALAGLNPVDADVVRRTILDAHDLSREQKMSLLALLTVYEGEETREAAGVPALRAGRRIGVVRVA